LNFLVLKRLEILTLKFSLSKLPSENSPNEKKTISVLKNGPLPLLLFVISYFLG